MTSNVNKLNYFLKYNNLHVIIQNTIKDEYKYNHTCKKSKSCEDLHTSILYIKVLSFCSTCRLLITLPRVCFSCFLPFTDFSQNLAPFFFPFNFKFQISLLLLTNSRSSLPSSPIFSPSPSDLLLSLFLTTNSSLRLQSSLPLPLISFSHSSSPLMLRRR